MTKFRLSYINDHRLNTTIMHHGRSLVDTTGNYPKFPLRALCQSRRSGVAIGKGDGVVDMTTLAAHDFDVDSRIGFMLPRSTDFTVSQPVGAWGAVLEHVVKEKFQLAIRWDPSEDTEGSAVGVRKCER